MQASLIASARAFLLAGSELDIFCKSLCDAQMQHTLQSTICNTQACGGDLHYWDMFERSVGVLCLFHERHLDAR